MVLRQLFLTANSPGEVAGWLSPLVHTLRQQEPQCKLTLILLPCTFATGSEARVAAQELGIEEIVAPRNYWKLLAQVRPDRRHSALLHLGGDLMYSAALVWRWKIKAWSYLWGRWWWDWAFQGYFIKDRQHLEWMRRHHLPLSKAIEVGDLVVDDVYYQMESYRQKYASLPAPDPQLISFMPGSRLAEVESLAPFFLETARIMRQSQPALRFQMVLSPFLEPSRLASALCAPPHPQAGGIQGRLQGETLVAPGISLELVRRHQLPHLSASQLAITIPGTKTAEAAALGTPQLMLLPLNRPELLPSIGLLGLLDWVPGGRRLKGQLLLHLQKKLSYLAQPNILAQRYVVPELIGVLTPAQVAHKALEMLAKPQELTAQRWAFHHLYTPSRGASQAIVEIIRNA